MPLDQNGIVPVVRLAELCAAISLFTDLGTGQPAEHAMRTCLVSMRLGDALGLQPDQRATLYYTALLSLSGARPGAMRPLRWRGVTSCASSPPWPQLRWVRSPNRLGA